MVEIRCKEKGQRARHKGRKGRKRPKERKGHAPRDPNCAISLCKACARIATNRFVAPVWRVRVLLVLCVLSVLLVLCGERAVLCGERAILYITSALSEILHFSVATNSAIDV